MANPPDVGVPLFRNPDTVPFIYFDLAPAYGFMAGIVEVELAARSLIPAPDVTTAEIVTTARLRCSPAAAITLRDALNKTLEIATQFREQAAPLGAIGTGTLN